jgi:hypothetical protein
MADQLHRINLMPWIGGLSTFGHAAIKRKEGLQNSQNLQYDFDGTKHRRGGQRHLHKIPVYEGYAFEEHFLDRTVDTGVWTETTGTTTFDTSTYSVLRGTTTGAGTGTQVASLEDSEGTALYKDLVQTVSTAATETDEMNICFRTRFHTLNAHSGSNYFSIRVDTGTADEWILDIHFGNDGIFFLTAPATWTEVSLTSGVVDERSAGVSSEYLLQKSSALANSSWHNWRVKITYNGSAYKGTLYLEEVAIYSNIPIYTVNPNANARAVTLSWVHGSGVTDVSIDNIEIQGEVQKIRGLSEFRKSHPSTVVGRTIFYAGTRMYQEMGCPWFIKCIDDGLDTTRICDIKIFRGKVIYTLDSGMKPRVWKIGDRRGKVLDAAPYMKYLQVHGNRVWGAGDPDYPSRLYFSGLLNEEIWNYGSNVQSFDDAGYININSEDGEEIKAIGYPYKNLLPVYKERSIHYITGTTPIYGTQGTFARVPMIKSLGCVSHRAIANVNNDQYFISKRGVHSLLTTEKYGDLETAFLSREIQDIWDRDVNINSLKLAMMVNNEPHDRVDLLLPFFALNADGQTPNRMLSLHYGLGREAFPEGMWSGPHTMTGWSMGMVQFTGAPRPLLVVGSSDGYLNLQDSTDRFDFPVYAS